MRDPQGYALLWGQLTGQYPQFVVNGNCNVTGITPPPEANISLDLAQPYFRMYAFHGKGTHSSFLSFSVFLVYKLHSFPPVLLSFLYENPSVLKKENR